ncbi:pyridine nucleotide transhydrogenase [Pasteurellaceae bacterium Pebbles2]|nr:pyridine nucleotide transhydrogenase [Pasteurellaceae bacterium Pebbles2]
MNNALIGYTGFVGQTLLKQTKFEHLFRSTNIGELDHQSFDTVVCSAAPAKKWIANKEPEQDLANINQLIDHLKTIKCKLFILISTVDVFKKPIDVDEKTKIDKENLHPYGLHRYYLEEFVASHFENYLIVRLPGLVGPGLQKNVIFDFLNNNNLNMIDSRGTFQFYPMVNLWSDIQIALKNQLKLVHLTTEQISVQEIAEQGFNFNFEQKLDNPVASYNMKSCYDLLFNGNNGYQYSKKEVLLAIRAFAQSEPITLK